jgi:RNA polymerase sigma-70 factor (ECF subfamily)
MSVEEVERAMRGDHDAFAALINSSANRMYALASLILRDTDRAQDATQEAIVRAWRELPRLRDPERFEAWLRRMVVNACYDEGRRTRRRAEVSLVHLVDRQTADSTAGFVESERIDRAFRRLPLDQRTTLVLQHKFGMSHVDIAETLGIPVGTVKSRIRYGITAMRAALEADDRLAAQPADGRTA